MNDEGAPAAGVQKGGRKEFILRSLRETGQVSVSEIADALTVSEMTVRRDLERLDREGLLRRVHGGATMKRGAFLSRAELQPDEKNRIASAAAEMISSGDSVGIDIGTTCHGVAVRLAARENLMIVTNSIYAALEFQYSRSTALVLGGQITNDASLVNGEQVGMAPEVHLDTLILGCGGVTAADGVSYFDLAETQIRQRLCGNASRTILVADHTKLQRRRPVLLRGGLDILDVLITSASPPGEMSRALAHAGVEVVVV